MSRTLPVQIDGELRARLMRNFDRLEGPEYQPAQVFAQTENDPQWPGDYEGRTILALSHLARVTGRTPKHLDALLEGLPRRLNAQGYLGPVAVSAEGMLPILDEQQLSGHGWLVSGLLAARDLTGNASLERMADRIVEALFLPMSGRMASYPTRPDARGRTGEASGQKVGQVGNWRLSSDIGCAFIALEGLVNAFERTRQPRLQALIDEMADTFAGIDLLGASLQLHASLTTARQLLRYHDTIGRPDLQALAARVYGLFRGEAITENCANYNWFGRPLSWTEPCAVVDALVCAVELWRKTGDTSYLEDAHDIYYNALCYAQKPHGGFGLENCVGGAEGDWLINTTYDVTWCCNMRGAVGLSALVDYAYLQTEDTLTLPFYFDSRVRAEFADGFLEMTQTTEYPYQGRVSLHIDRAMLPSPKTLRLFLPSWADPRTVALRVNGQSVEPVIDGGFVTLSRSFATGDTVALSFPYTLRTERTRNIHTIPGRNTLRHGPLILGSAVSDRDPTIDSLREVGPGVYQEQPDGPRLAPINDSITLTEAQAKGDRRRILFPRELPTWAEAHVYGRSASSPSGSVTADSPLERK